MVEDSTTSATLLTRYLRDLGAQVEVRPYGADTVIRASALQPDVILLDLLLPDQDGWDVLRQLKANPQTQPIPVLLVSVVDEPTRARELGAAGLLCKPLDRDTLLRALRQLFSHPGEPPVQNALIIAPAPTKDQGRNRSQGGPVEHTGTLDRFTAPTLQGWLNQSAHCYRQSDFSAYAR